MTAVQWFALVSLAFAAGCLLGSEVWGDDQDSWRPLALIFFVVGVLALLSPLFS